MRFWIVNPTTRPSFRLVAYEINSSGDRVVIPEDDQRLKFIRPRFKVINEMFRSGAINQLEARAQIEAMVRAEYKAMKDFKSFIRASVENSVNDAAFDEFWRVKYSRRENKDLNSAKYDFQRAIRTIEPLPLLTTKPEDLYARITSICGKDTAKRRRVVIKVNEMLSFFGIRELLNVPPAKRMNVRYLTKDEVILLANNSPDLDTKLYILTLFATGVRTAEALMLGTSGINHEDKAVYVSTQLLLRSGVVDDPKRGSSGWVSVIPEFWDDVLAFMNMPIRDRKTYERLYKYVREGVKKLWPRTGYKHIKPHDLRHSHAIYLLEQGASLEQVKLNLRNSIVICERHYTGFAHTKATVSGLNQLLSSPKVRQGQAALSPGPESRP